MGDRYLKTTSGFMAGEGFNTIAFESTSTFSPQEVELNLQDVIKNIDEHVEKF